MALFSKLMRTCLNLIGIRPKGARVRVRFEIHSNPLFFSISVNQLKRFVYQCLHVDFRNNRFLFTNIGKELMGNRPRPFDTFLDFSKGLIEGRPVGYLRPTPFLCNTVLQVTGRLIDDGQRVVNLMGHTRRQRPKGRKSLRGNHLLFDAGLVFRSRFLLLCPI
jgi:hypothetical protein